MNSIMARTENTKYAINVGMNSAQRTVVKLAADECGMTTAYFCRETILIRANKVIKLKRLHAQNQEWLARQVAANPSTQVKE